MATWALDLDGVLWRGEMPIPGAAEAVTRSWTPTWLSAEDNIQLAHGDVWVGSGSFKLPSDAPLGRYDVYLTYQTADGVYHDGLSNSFDVTVDGSPLPFDIGPPTVNGTVTADPARSPSTPAARFFRAGSRARPPG